MSINIFPYFWKAGGSKWGVVFKGIELMRWPRFSVKSGVLDGPTSTCSTCGVLRREIFGSDAAALEQRLEAREVPNTLRFSDVPCFTLNGARGTNSMWIVSLDPFPLHQMQLLRWWFVCLGNERLVRVRSHFITTEGFDM